MTLKNHDPAGIHAPLGSYTHAVEMGGGMRRVSASGRVGRRPDGSPGAGMEGEPRPTGANIAAILSAADMTLRDIVKITTIVVRTEDLKVHGRIRAEVLGEHRAAATGFCVTQLATPDMLCEIEVTAAGPRR